jgi:hypothetical protein
MTIAYSAPNWNQTNEATKTIASVAGVTGGIRCTSTSHGYANGDFIRITSSTDYNGAWVVSNVATNTFDIVDQGLVFGVTRTGNANRGDKNPDALNGLTNVTRAQITIGSTTGSASILRNEYTMTGGKLQVAGAMLIPAYTHRLIFGTGAAFNEITINSGGYLVIRDRSATSAKWVYNFSEAFRTQKLRADASPTWSEPAAAITVKSGGTLVLDGGALQSSSVYVNSGGTIILNGGYFVGNVWWSVSGSTQVPAFIVLASGSTAVVNGIKMGPGSIFLVQSSVDSVYSNIIFGNKGSEADAGTAGGAYDKWTCWKNPNSTVEDAFAHTNTRGARIELRNDKDGSAAKTAFNEHAASYPKARFLMTREVQFLNKNPAGSLIQDVLAFTRDVNNGSRSDIGSGAGNVYVNDFLYSGSSDANGLTPTFLFILNVRRPTSAADATPINDNRCLVPATDTHRWYLVSYLYEPVAYDISCRAPIGPIVQANTVVVDAAVTQTTKATVAAYSTLTDSNEVYDWLKYWNTLNQANAEYPSPGVKIVVANGNLLDFGSRKVSVLSGNTLGVNTGTNTISIKASSIAATSKLISWKSTDTISATLTTGGAYSYTGTLTLPLNTPTLAGGTINIDGTGSYTFSSTGTLIVKLTPAAPGTYTINGTHAGTLDLRNQAAHAITVALPQGTTYTIANNPGGNGAITVTVAPVTTTIAGSVSLIGAEIRIYDLDNVPAGSLGTELAGIESCAGATFDFDAQASNSVWIQIMKDGYVEFGQQFTVPSTASTFTAILAPDPNV